MMIIENMKLTIHLIHLMLNIIDQIEVHVMDLIKKVDKGIVHLSI